jgi:hypothetical protein
VADDISKLIEAIKDKDANLEEQIKSLKQINELQKERVDMAKVGAEYAEEYEKSLKAQLDLEKKLLRGKEEARKEILQQLEAAKDANNADQVIELTKAYEDLAGKINESEKAISSLEKRVGKTGKALENLDKRMGSVFKTFLGIEKRSQGVIGDFIELAKESGGVVGAIKQLGTQFREYMNLQSISKSLYDKIIESTLLYAKEIDGATSSLAATTGATTKYNKSLIENGRKLLEYGLSVDDVGASMESLYTNMLTSTELAEQQRVQLALTAAQMTKLGVSTDTTTGLYDGLIKGMGFTSDQAEDMAKGMVSLAQDLQMPPKMLIEGFADATKALAAYGKQAPKIFKKVAAAAKATGIETNRLLGITEQFDTFEGAAQAAGNLNAILGGDLVNSMELVGATEEERIAILQRVGAVAKQQYAGMDEVQRRFFVKSLGKSLGIADQEVMKFMNTSTSALENYTAKAEESTTNQDKLNKTLAAATTFGEKVEGMIKKVSLPIGEAIQGMETLFAEANAGLDTMLEKIPGGSMGIFAGALGVGAAADAFSAILGGAGGAALGGAAGKAIKGALSAATTFVTSAAFIKAALAGLATYGFIRIVENALGLEGTLTNIKNFVTSGFDTQYVPGLQRLGTFSATPQTSSTTLPSNATTVREANTQAAMAPVAQMSAPVNNRDLVVQANGKEIGRLAAKELNKALGYQY